MSITEKVKQELIRLNEQFPLELYWDYRYDSLSNEHIQKIVEGNAHEVYEEIMEMNLDHICTIEDERLKEAFNEVNKDEDLNYDDVRDELKDNLLDYLYVDINLEELIDRTNPINVRIEMLSNYDCINSHYFEGSYSYEKSYFGDMVDTLNLNPKIVKGMLESNGIECEGNWEDIPSRNGNGYVSYKDFLQEIENSSCGANLLTFMGTINLSDYIDRKESIKKVTVPKGNFCGLFSSYQGGGSVLEMELKRDFTVKLGTKDYYGYKMEIDNSSGGYSMQEVYGLSQSAWKSNIKF